MLTSSLFCHSWLVTCDRTLIVCPLVSHSAEILMESIMNQTIFQMTHIFFNQLIFLWIPSCNLSISGVTQCWKSIYRRKLLPGIVTLWHCHMFLVWCHDGKELDQFELQLQVQWIPPHSDNRIQFTRDLLNAQKVGHLNWNSKHTHQIQSLIF